LTFTSFFASFFAFFSFLSAFPPPLPPFFPFAPLPLFIFLIPFLPPFLFPDALSAFSNISKRINSSFAAISFSCLVIFFNFFTALPTIAAVDTDFAILLAMIVSPEGTVSRTSFDMGCTSLLCAVFSINTVFVA